jgi:hypothetical protein
VRQPAGEEKPGQFPPSMALVKFQVLLSERFLRLDDGPACVIYTDRRSTLALRQPADADVGLPVGVAHQGTRHHPAEAVEIEPVIPA